MKTFKQYLFEKLKEEEKEEKSSSSSKKDEKDEKSEKDNKEDKEEDKAPKDKKENPFDNKEEKGSSSKKGNSLEDDEEISTKSDNKVATAKEENPQKEADEYEDIKNVLDLFNMSDFKLDKDSNKDEDEQFKSYINKKINKIENDKVSFDGLEEMEYSESEISMIKQMIKDKLENIEYKDRTKLSNEKILDTIKDELVPILQQHCLNTLAIDSTGEKIYKEWDDIEVKRLSDVDLKKYIITVNKIKSISAEDEEKEDTDE